MGVGGGGKVELRRGKVTKRKLNGQEEERKRKRNPAGEDSLMVFSKKIMTDLYP
jgi:hypothetical protein